MNSKNTIVGDFFQTFISEFERINPDVINLLCTIPFRICDMNRKMDAMEYRITWVNLNERHYLEREIDILLEYPITVWEILYGLAVRLSNAYINVDPDFFINKFILNLGVDPNSKYAINLLPDLIENWQNGNIKNDGTGSIFHLNQAKRGFKHLSLWDQSLIFISDLLKDVTF